ncbi:hypothetical protein MZM54_01580 [[Brevibacterium] frigoritolerans]|nr:hypothetical protein [Peribacillus frigoritolerans]
MNVMGYQTYFIGEMEIELGTQHLSNLKANLSHTFGSKNTVIVEENFLKIDDEWKNGGSLENIILFIEKYGKLISGTIKCYGENSTDVWEVIIKENKPFYREVGSSLTSHRATRRQRVDLTNVAKEYRLT